MKKFYYCILTFFSLITLSCSLTDKDSVTSTNTEITAILLPPQNLSVTIEDTGAKVSWSPVNGAEKYNLYIHVSYELNKTNFTKKYICYEAGFCVSDFLDMKTYYFCATAVNAAGESEISQIVSIVPLLKIIPSTAEIKINETQQFTLIYIDETNKQIDNVNTIWTSSDINVATIDSTGLAKGIKPGTTTISATVNNKTSTAELKVVSDTNIAPDFSLSDMYGNMVSLSNYSGKVIILDFWATWCGPCRSEIPHFVELYNTYKDQGLVIIGVDVDPSEGPDILKPFAAQYGITYPLLLGTENVENLYGGIQYIPTTFIIDRNGGIVQKFVGSRDKATFENEIKKLL